MISRAKAILSGACLYLSIFSPMLAQAELGVSHGDECGPETEVLSMQLCALAQRLPEISTITLVSRISSDTTSCSDDIRVTAETSIGFDWIRVYAGTHTVALNWQVLALHNSPPSPLIEKRPDPALSKVIVDLQKIPFGVSILSAKNRFSRRESFYVYDNRNVFNTPRFYLAPSPGPTAGNIEDVCRELFQPRKACALTKTLIKQSRFPKAALVGISRRDVDIYHLHQGNLEVPDRAIEARIREEAKRRNLHSASALYRISCIGREHISDAHNMTMTYSEGRLRKTGILPDTLFLYRWDADSNTLVQIPNQHRNLRLGILSARVEAPSGVIGLFGSKMLLPDATSPESEIVYHGAWQSDPGSEIIHRWAGKSYSTRSGATPRIAIASSTAISFRVIDHRSVGESVSGLKSVKYYVDNDVPREFAADSKPFLLNPGTHTLRHQAADAAMNAEPVRKVNVFVDAIPPETQLSVIGAGMRRADAKSQSMKDQPQKSRADEVVTTQSRIHFAPHFNDSELGIGDWQWRPAGPSKFELLVDGKRKEYRDSLTLSQGHHLVSFRAVDSVGNVEAWQSYRIDVRANLPAGSIKIGRPAHFECQPPDGPCPGWFVTEDTPIRFDYHGVAKGDDVLCSVDGGQPKRYIAPFRLNKGSHVISCYISTIDGFSGNGSSVEVQVLPLHRYYYGKFRNGIWRLRGTMSRLLWTLRSSMLRS